MASKLPPKLRNLALTGYTCPCCMDTGSHMFGYERRDCGYCDYAQINNDILERLPSTFVLLAEELDWWSKDTLSEHIATLLRKKRVTFKNNGKQGVLIVRVGE